MNPYLDAKLVLYYDCRHFFMRLLILLIFLTTIHHLAISQVVVNMPDVKERPIATAISLSQQPTMDGKVIGDEV